MSIDILAASGLALLGAVVAWWLYTYFDPLRTGSEQWFQSDLAAVWSTLTDRYSHAHERTHSHPLFSLVNTTFVYALRAIGLDVALGARVWMSAAAGAVIGLSYATARLLKAPAFDACLVALLVLSSASLLFWAPVPETRTATAASMLVCLAAAAFDERRPLPDWALVIAAAVSLSMTSSIFMVGVLLLAVRRPPLRAAQLAVNAFFVVCMLEVVQNVVFPHATSLIDVRRQGRFFFDPTAGTPLNKVAVAIFHSVVMPRVETPLEFDTQTPMLSIQRVGVGASGPVELSAAVLWGLLLGWGSIATWKASKHSTAATVLGLTACGQVLFHLAYGDQTFLYTLHFVPVLVLIAAQAVLSKPAVGRTLLAATLVLTTVNNVAHVSYARNQLERIVPLGAPAAP